MRVLFIGGTGVISTACTRLAAARGLEVVLLNRGRHAADVPTGVRVLHADANDRQGVERTVAGQTFDAVVDWIVFDTEAVERDIALFAHRTGQYVFISSASAYQKPPTQFLITESTPLANPFWEYSRKKIACEERLLRAYREDGFPVTIVRPSHTYGPTMLPTAVGGGPTVLGRMRQGRKVIVHGDGESLWVLTHNTDFAKGLVGLLGHPQALGHAFHITSDQVLTWNQIYREIGRAAGVEPELVHIPSDFIARHDPATGPGLLGDKAISVVFDNGKVKRLVSDFACTVPFSRGVEESVAWLDADPERGRIDPERDAVMDRIIRAYEGGLEGIG
ncbi:MAG: SDR family oxidoreductase [Candidatus Latescibacterota bacterium]